MGQINRVMSSVTAIFVSKNKKIFLSFLGPEITCFQRTMYATCVAYTSTSIAWLSRCLFDLGSWISKSLSRLARDGKAQPVRKKSGGAAIDHAELITDRRAVLTSYCQLLASAGSHRFRAVVEECVAVVGIAHCTNDGEQRFGQNVRIVELAEFFADRIGELFFLDREL